MKEMILRKSNDRFRSNYGWLDAKHSFNFGNHYSPEFQSFSSLLVINEDKIAPSKGFGSHPHDNMEILTYIISGELEHRDSMGNGRVIRAGEMQYMSAGSGVTHSEFNPSKENECHLLQIWILPNKNGLEPRYKDFNTNDLVKRNELVLVAGSEDTESEIKIRQDMELYYSRCDGNKDLKLSFNQNLRKIWVQMISGSVTFGDQSLEAGDGFGVEVDSDIKINSREGSEFIFFYLS